MKKNYVIIQIKIPINILNRRLEPDEKRIVEDRSEEITLKAMEIRRWIKEKFRHIVNRTRKSNENLIGVPEDDKENGKEALFKETVAMTFL